MLWKLGHLESETNKSLFAGFTAAALLIASSASAALVADFQLNNSLANGAAGGVTLTDNTMGGLGATGIVFGAEEGPTLNNLGLISVYTLEIGATLDAVNGYRKIADFSGRTSDIGLYTLNGDIDFYPFAFGPGGTLSAGSPFVVKLTRDASSLVTGYFNGVSQFSFLDTGGDAVINGSLHLFQDDFAVPGEAASGFIDYVTLDTGAVPEPGTWALMIGGFGMAGAMIRRRKALAA